MAARNGNIRAAANWGWVCRCSLVELEDVASLLPSTEAEFHYRSFVIYKQDEQMDWLILVLTGSVEVSGTVAATRPDGPPHRLQGWAASVAIPIGQIPAR